MQQHTLLLPPLLPLPLLILLMMQFLPILLVLLVLLPLHQRTTVILQARKKLTLCRDTFRFQCSTHWMVVCAL